MLLQLGDPKFIQYLRLYWSELRRVLEASSTYADTFRKLLQDKGIDTIDGGELAITSLLWEILYGSLSGECILKLDELLRRVDGSLYKRVHLDVKETPTTKLFFEKFFDEDNPMKLDQIAMCCRPEDLKDKELVVLERLTKYLTPVKTTNGEPDVVHSGREFIRHIPQVLFPNDQWYYILLKASRSDPHNRAMLDYLQPDYEEVLEEHRRQQEEEKERKKKTSGSAKRKHVGDAILSMRLQKDYRKSREESNDGEPDGLTLRSYQEELVENAIRGNDTIVCAPTGSGKTEVCIYVALHHMKKRENEGKPSRVVMIVPKCVLVDQQKKRFHKYMKGEKYVDGFQGEEGQTTSLRRNRILACDVVVMTPQILYNMLVSIWDEDHLSLCDFSLLIFDEAHHCDKQHTYKLLADLIKNCKADQRPQIMGLTASLLTATAATDENSSLLNIYRLLANFGATTLSMVRTYTKELDKYVAKPDEYYSKECDPESNHFADLLKTVIRAVIDKMKEDLQALNKKRADGNFLKEDINIGEPGRLLERFIGRVNVLKCSLERLGRDGREKARPIQGCKVLLILAKTLEIDNLMPSKYAMEFLKHAMIEFADNNGMTTASDFVDIYMKYRSHLVKQSDEVIKKPIIEKLISVIRDKFAKEPDSRCIVFVNERSTCKVLSDALNESQLFLDASDVVRYIFSAKSRGASSATNNQSQTDQRRTLGDFNTGNIKILVSTSVLDEGLDVSSCNLIIKYNCASTVVSRIQKAGRARAKGSESWFLCLSHSVATQEFNAIVASNMLKRCLTTIANNGPRALEQQILQVMEDQRRAEENRKREADERKKELKNNNYDIHCKICNTPITKSVSLYFVKNHVGCFDVNIWNVLNIRVVDREKKTRYIDSVTQMLGEAYCIGGRKMEDIVNFGTEPLCGQRLGKIMRYATVYIPVLSSGDLNFYRTDASDTAEDVPEDLGKSWKTIKTNFFIPEVCPTDFKDDDTPDGFGTFADSLEESVQLDKFYQLQRQLEKMEQQMIKLGEAKIRQQEREAKLAEKPKTDWFAMDEAEENENEQESMARPGLENPDEYEFDQGLRDSDEEK